MDDGTPWETPKARPVLLSHAFPVDVPSKPTTEGAANPAAAVDEELLCEVQDHFPGRPWRKTVSDINGVISPMGSFPQPFKKRDRT